MSATALTANPEHFPQYNRALELTGCESIEATLRARRLLWAGALIRMDDERLPKRVMFGKVKDGVKKGWGG